MPLRELSLEQLLGRFSSPDPTPGGGSAAALASAVGASLLMMVSALPKTRTGSEAERVALAGAARALAAGRDDLAAAVDDDTAAYDAVVAAYKLPKGDAAAQAARTAAIQRALQGATEVPLRVMQRSADALAHAETIAANGHRAAASDVGVAVALLRAGADGARLNVATNVGSLTDVETAASLEQRTADAARDVERRAAEAERLLRAG